MLPLLFIFIFAFLQESLCQSDVANTTTAFRTANIVPDVVNIFSPVAALDIQFPSFNITPGSVQAQADVASRPLFFLTGGEFPAGQSFVVIMVDPDAPTPQNRSVALVRHFLGGGFSLNGTALTNSTPALSDYRGPGPPAGSDPHRYVVLVYEEPSAFTTTAARLVNSTTPIINFNLTTFGRETGLAEPVAGNYWLTGPASQTTASSSGTATQPTSTAPSSQSSQASTASGSTPSGSQSAGNNGLAVQVSVKLLVYAILPVIVGTAL